MLAGNGCCELWPSEASRLQCGEENPRRPSPTSPPMRLRCGSRTGKQMKMNLVSLLRHRVLPIRWLAPGRCLAWVTLLALAGAGCGREEIQVYTVPKDKPALAAQAKGRPQLSWTLPKDWKEAGAGQMTMASFSIQG